MPNWTHVGAILASLVGGFFLGLGVYGSIDAWATMQQIEAHGVIGQAVYQERYENAVSDLQLYALLAVLGFILTIGGSIEYLRGTLKELVGP